MVQNAKRFVMLAACGAALMCILWPARFSGGWRSPLPNISDESAALAAEPETTGDAMPAPQAAISACRIEAVQQVEDLEPLLEQLSRLSTPHRDDLPAMIERRTVRVLTTYSLSSFFVEGGQGHGFEYSLAKEYERFLNQRYTRRDLHTVIEYIPVPEALLVPSLLSGIGDIVAAGRSIRHLPETGVRYTDPYLTGVHHVLVFHKDSPAIAALADLSDRQILIRPIQGQMETIQQINAVLAEKQLPPMRVTQANTYLTVEDTLELVNAGVFDLTLVENHFADTWTKVMPNVRTADHILADQHYAVAWMVRADNPLLRDSLNQFLKRYRKGTLHGNIYFDRYFNTIRWIKHPLAPVERQRFATYTPLFKKYGQQYGIDWMLLAALAFQESGLDPHVRSHAGAVGLMQVLPSTANDKRIQISNIDDIEGNIHAGTKYLALLRDTYFHDLQAYPARQLRFSLAAYNAGPQKISRLRQTTLKMGFDPNRWFQHGEFAALKYIGQEPVRFVSNINKYYLAYTLGDTLDCLKDQHLEHIGNGLALATAP
jgi:membrane-bound lytic murein transglycosylase MltF